jgi:hypothetical protein
MGACVLRLLVVFAPRTSSTPVATWFWQTEDRSAECVILGVRLSEFILLEFQYPSRRIFIGSHSLPPLWSPNRSFNGDIIFMSYSITYLFFVIKYHILVYPIPIDLSNSFTDARRLVLCRYSTYVSLYSSFHHNLCVSMCINCYLF